MKKGLEMVAEVKNECFEWEVFADTEEGEKARDLNKALLNLNHYFTECRLRCRERAASP